MIKISVIVLSLVLSFFFVACSQKPTKIYEVNERTAKTGKSGVSRAVVLRPGLDQPIVISDKTIVLDARSAFAFSMAHIRRSSNLKWEEFSQKKVPYLGLLDGDLFFHTRRLARLGIKPDSDVLIVGEGAAGKGEEGRLAWTLYYLGVKNVRYASIEMFRHGWTNMKTEKKSRNVKSWKPRLQKSVLIDRDELEKKIQVKRLPYFKSRGSGKVSNGHMSISKDGPVLIDVREESEYASQRQGLMAMNVPWKEFLDEKGRPQVSISERLRSVGVGKEREIILISNRGVRSAAVTMILLDLGFVNASNYAGGYLEYLQ